MGILQRLTILLLTIPCCLLLFAASGRVLKQTGGLTAEFRHFTALYKNDNINETEINNGYKFVLKNGQLNIFNKDNTNIWQSKKEWYVDSFKIGDINCDQIPEIVFVLWKSYSFGTAHPIRMANDDASVKCHLFVYSIKDDRLKSIWCSSNLPRPIYSLELDMDGEKTPVLSGARIITREGVYTDDYRKTPADEYIYVWNVWGFSPADN